MLNYLKQWYEENFTDPNQVSLALIVIFSVLITYILIQTISPILVAIVLAYMLEGLVQNLMKTAHIVRNISVILVFVIFLILMINKGIRKAVRFTGLGSLDTMFGFFFGFIKAYIISVCIFSGVHIVYNYDKWPVNLSKSLIFPYLEKGSNYLLEKFPDEKTYQKSKEKIENI